MLFKEIRSHLQLHISMVTQISTSYLEKPLARYTHESPACVMLALMRELSMFPSLVALLAHIMGALAYAWLALVQNLTVVENLDQTETGKFLDRDGQEFLIKRARIQLLLCLVSLSCKQHQENAVQILEIEVRLAISFFERSTLQNGDALAVVPQTSPDNTGFEMRPDKEKCLINLLEQPNTRKKQQRSELIMIDKREALIQLKDWRHRMISMVSPYIVTNLKHKVWMCRASDKLTQVSAMGNREEQIVLHNPNSNGMIMEKGQKLHYLLEQATTNRKQLAGIPKPNPEFVIGNLIPYKLQLKKFHPSLKIQTSYSVIIPIEIQPRRLVHQQGLAANQQYLPRIPESNFTPSWSQLLIFRRFTLVDKGFPAAGYCYMLSIVMHLGREFVAS